MEPLLGMPAGWLPRDSAQLDTYMRRCSRPWGGRADHQAGHSRGEVLYPPQWHAVWPAFRAMQLLTMGSLGPSIRRAYGYRVRRARRAGAQRAGRRCSGRRCGCFSHLATVADGEASGSSPA